MALNIKNANVERLASEMANALGTTKTQAIEIALEKLREWHGQPSRAERMKVLQKSLEPWRRSVPPEALRPITKEEWDAVNEVPE